MKDHRNSRNVKLMLVTSAMVSRKKVAVTEGAGDLVTKHDEEVKDCFY